jgi:hypothetical protein
MSSPLMEMSDLRPADGGRVERRHAPGASGFWLHPRHEITLDEDEHHRDYFMLHPELFGHDLVAAYDDGWISIRRWIGTENMWAVAYGRRDTAWPVLTAWARRLLAKRPEETAVAVEFVAVSETESAPGTTLGGLASGQ